MAERAKLWVYFAFGIWFTLIYSIVSHWIWSPHGWLFKKGMQDFAGSTVVHYQGALAALAGALILGPRIGKFGTDGRANPIPGHNIPYAVLGHADPLVRLVRLQPGLDAVGRLRRLRLLRLRRDDDEHRRRRGRGRPACASRGSKLGKPDISMMLNGALGALVAITAASGLRRAVGGDRDRPRLRLHRRRSA